jgi:hypothetical protein
MSRHLLILIAALLASARNAHAQSTIDVYLQVKPADSADPKQRGKAPKI